MDDQINAFGDVKKSWNITGNVGGTFPVIFTNFTWCNHPSLQHHPLHSLSSVENSRSISNTIVDLT